MNLQDRLIHLKEVSITFKKRLTLRPKRELFFLLSRMVNLEMIYLEFLHQTNSLLNDNILQKYCTDRMPRLNKLTCNIVSIIHPTDPRVPSNEEIQRTFRTLEDNSIIVSTYRFIKQKLLICHMYTLPYTSTIHHIVTLDFSGEMFKSVRVASLVDDRPFEHHFFLQIARAFPFLEKLTLCNNEQQQNIRIQYPTIIYRRLFEIILIKVHADYIDQFMNSKKICLLNGVELQVKYQLLRQVTDDFTSDQTRNNSSKIRSLKLIGEEKKEDLHENITQYFPHARIDIHPMLSI